MRARDYEEVIFYSEKEYKPESGVEEGKVKTTKVTRTKDKRYINHKLEMNPGHSHYDFTQELKGDFNTLLKIHGMKERSLQGLAGELREAMSLEDKKDNLVKYIVTTRKGRSVGIIIIKNRFLPSDTSFEEDTKEEKELSDEEKKDLEDEFKF